MKQTDRNTNTESPIPPGVDAVFLVTCRDVVMGRGSGTQNHCGNVTYRKLVYLNKVSVSVLVGSLGCYYSTCNC